MAIYLWSLWEIWGLSCYNGDRAFLIIRLMFGVVSQFWCSFVTFPLYIIVAQMGSKFKKTIVSENVSKSLHGWRRKVKTRHGGTTLARLPAAPALDPITVEGENNVENTSSGSKQGPGLSKDLFSEQSPQ